MRGERVRLLLSQHHARLDGFLGITERDPHQEAVELGLGQRERAHQLHRVLGRDQEERLGQRVARAVHRDLALLHRLEQRRLRARRGAVDLVRQQHVREHRSLPELEGQLFRVVEGDSGHVARQQVGGALDAPELALDRARHGACQHGLPDARHVLDQHVAAREQRRDDRLDRLALAQDDALDVLDQLPCD
jgi:hypothetical protein